MGQEETSYHQWTAEELVRETLSNFESLEGMDSVEWLIEPSNVDIHYLIRIRLQGGNVMRLSMTCLNEYGSAEIFDDSFDESAC